MDQVQPSRLILDCDVDYVEVAVQVPSWAIEKFGFGDEAWHLNVLVNAALTVLPAAATMLILRMRDKV